MRERMVRVGAFLRGELITTLRQPRLLLVLVLGPFLILLVFGLGYEHTLPPLETLVVAGDDELTDRIEDYVREQQPAGISHRGTTRDRDAALDALWAGDVDVVVVLPDQGLETLGRGERAVIEIHERSHDPVTINQVDIAAQSAVHQINDAVLEQGLAGAKEELPDQAHELRRLGDQLDRLAGVAGLRQLEEAASTLEQLDGAVGLLRDLDPAVAVRPLEAQVVSQIPVPVTLHRFYAAGLVALMLQHVGVTFAALALVRERQTGTTELLRVLPATTGERLAGKTLAFVLLGGAAVAALTALSVLVFDVAVPVDWLAFVVLVTLALLASLGLGFLAAALSRTHSQAVQFSMLLLLAAIFFSGLFMPLERIEPAAQVVSWVLPATHAFTGLQDLTLLAVPPSWTRYVGLAAIALVAFAAARLLLSPRPPRRP